MISISNNIITMDRSDKLSIPLFINAGDAMNKLRYIVQPGDQVMLSIMSPNQEFDCGVIRKLFTSANLNSYGDIIITLNDTDTVNVLPGTYYYQIKLGIKIGNIYEYSTVIPKRKFVLL